MAVDLDELASQAGISWFDYQTETFEDWETNTSPQPRALLHYRTGAGKSITALAMLLLNGEREAVVITPPSTFEQWGKAAATFGMAVECMSHAKFRQATTKLSRTKAVIADEFHLFGGHGGKGWKKLDVMSRHLQAPLIMASATPNYNDAERVYCIQHILNPQSLKGGYLAFLHAHCQLEHDPFSAVPKVLGFLHHKDAASYLQALPWVYYVEDNVVFTIEEHDVLAPVPDEFDVYKYKRRDHRMMASGMEERHARIDLQLIDDSGLIPIPVFDALWHLRKKRPGPVLIYSRHATVARALAETLALAEEPYGLVTGSHTTLAKALVINQFKAGEFDILIGTASLATGTDGLDKMCDTLIILDDTDDDAHRRQLIGRIMPRGADVDATMKQVHRINVTSF